MINVGLSKSNSFLTTQVMASASNTATEYNTPTTVTIMVPATLMPMGVMAAQDTALEAVTVVTCNSITRPC